LAQIHAVLKQGIKTASNGSDAVSFPGINVDKPYHGVFTSSGWGFNRANLGVVNEILMYFDLTGERAYGDVGMDNINFLLGANPFDLSFILGCGDRNLQHPHYRAANPDGFNQDGDAYPHRVPVGAVMGGVHPAKVLQDDWQRYTATETCIDYAAQAVFPLLIMSPNDGSVAIGRKSVHSPNPGLRKSSGAGRDLLGRRKKAGGPFNPRLPAR
jgi:hypothetical protein